MFLDHPKKTEKKTRHRSILTTLSKKEGKDTFYTAQCKHKQTRINKFTGFISCVNDVIKKGKCKWSLQGHSAPPAGRYSLTNEANSSKVNQSLKNHDVHVTQGHHLPARCKCASIYKQVRSPPGPEQWEPDEERKLRLIFHTSRSACRLQTLNTQLPPRK